MFGKTQISPTPLIMGFQKRKCPRWSYQVQGKTLGAEIQSNWRNWLFWNFCCHGETFHLQNFLEQCCPAESPTNSIWGESWFPSQWSQGRSLHPHSCLSQASPEFLKIEKEPVWSQSSSIKLVQHSEHVDNFPRIYLILSWPLLVLSHFSCIFHLSLSRWFCIVWQWSIFHKEISFKIS